MAGEAGLRDEVKRFRELWIGDDRFRDAVLADPEAATAAAGLQIDPAPLSFLWRPGDPVDTDTPESRAHRELDQTGQAYLAFCENDRGAAESYRAWRARQRARSVFAQGPAIAEIGLHLPFAFELTRGCSLGCWFCGLSAAPLEAVLPTDLDAWEKMLTALHGVFGESAVRGMLYWATDPMDHPDYEAYGEVFRRVLGRFPATTTAAPLADPDRTRRLIALARSGDCPSVRFSAVSRRQLDDIHAEFSAAELADVIVLPLNRESVLALAETGRARDKIRRRPERGELERSKLAPDGEDHGLAHQTIACVSGFLVEPVIGRIRLISPEPSSDRWPDGFVVFDEARFGNPGEFVQAVDRMIARNMTPELPGRLALQRGVTVVSRTRTEVTAEGRGHVVTFRSKQRDLAFLPALAEAFRGGAAAADVASSIADRFGLERRQLLKDMTDLWNHGVLIETMFSLADAETGEASAPRVRETAA